MYAWIWRMLPFGLRGKIGGSILLLAGTFSLLWYVIFPWAEPLLPFDDVQVGDPDSGYIDVVDPSAPADPSASASPDDLDDHEIPYDTDGD